MVGSLIRRPLLTCVQSPVGAQFVLPVQAQTGVGFLSFLSFLVVRIMNLLCPNAPGDRKACEDCFHVDFGFAQCFSRLCSGSLFRASAAGSPFFGLTDPLASTTCARFPSLTRPAINSGLTQFEKSQKKKLAALVLVSQADLLEYRGSQITREKGPNSLF